MGKRKKNELIDYRVAIAEEIPDIALIFTEHIGTSVPGDKAKRMGRLAELICDRNCRVYLAATEDEVVGFSIVTVNRDDDKPFGVLDNIIVRAKYRRRGIGRELLAKSIAWLCKRNIDSLFLETGCNTHEAHGFFAGCGFEHKSYTLHLSLSNVQ
jgi:ribosomal protein S18 acetylase RimI-like enzyme